MRPTSLLAALLILSNAAAAAPNILLFLADDLGARDLGCTGSTFYETPHLDALARQGVRFTDAYAANPVCSPTRYSVQTGKHPTRAGITNWLAGVRVERFEPAPLTLQMALEETTIAEYLRPAGYRTVHVGKWHLGSPDTFWPEHQGYDVNIGGYGRGQPNSWFAPYKNERIVDGPPGEHLTERLARETVRQIEIANAARQPFFISHCLFQVHTPLKAPADLIAKYEAKAARLGLKDEFHEEKQVFVSTDAPRRVRSNQAHPTYAAMVEAMDTAVGRILQRLDELGLADDTLVLFTSDNGGLSTAEGSPTSNLPFRAGKGWIYEGGIRVPFLARWPARLPAGSVNGTPIVSTDILTTVLAAAGVPVPPEANVDGRSILPTARGEATSPRDLVWHYPHYSNQGGFPGGAIRAGDWKLIENFEDGGLELFNLATDPGERRDLAAAEPARVEALRARLHAWYRATGARFLSARDGGPGPWVPGGD